MVEFKARMLGYPKTEHVFEETKQINVPAQYVHKCVKCSHEGEGSYIQVWTGDEPPKTYWVEVLALEPILALSTDLADDREIQEFLMEIN